MRVLYNFNSDNFSCVVHDTVTSKNYLMDIYDFVDSVYDREDRVAGFDYDCDSFSVLTLCSTSLDLSGRVVQHVEIPMIDGLYSRRGCKFYLDMCSAGMISVDLDSVDEKVIGTFWVLPVTEEPNEGIMVITKDDTNYYQYDYIFDTGRCAKTASRYKGSSDFNMETKRGILKKGEV